MGPGFYLCGCAIGAKRNYATYVLPNGGVTDKRVDSEGFEVCPEHGIREYGWMIKLQKKQKQLRRANRVGTLAGFEAPDLRDNRDPQEIGRAILSKGNGSIHEDSGE